MELWIRSQDREMIYKANEIFYYRCTEAHSIQVNHENFGKYKSKERALEVLDEIEESTLGNFSYRCPSNVKASKKEDTIIYEMPEE